MSKKLINLIIILDAIIGLLVAIFRMNEDILAPMNYLAFIYIVYLYIKTGRNIYYPFFVFELIVFSLLLFDIIFPSVLQENNLILNNIIISLGILGFIYFFIKTIRLIRK